MNGKIDAKSDEGIFIRFSTKSKAYKCFNSNTNKVVESANVKVDEYAEKNEVKCKIEHGYYNTFIYVNESVPCTLPKQENKATKQQLILNVNLLI